MKLIELNWFFDKINNMDTITTTTTKFEKKNECVENK